MFKNIDQTRLILYSATAVGTAYIYNSLGLLDMLTSGKTVKKDFKTVINELKPQLLTACYYWDGLPSIIDEKSQETKVLRARLYFYGSPVNYPNPPVIREAQQTEVKVEGKFWDGIRNIIQAMEDDAKNPAIDQRYNIYNIIRDAINMGDSSLPQKIPTEDELKFLTGVYNQYKGQIVTSWNNGIKTRIPHQPYLSCLPIVLEILKKAGYQSMFNENAALYRLISFQETMRRELPINDNKVIVDGINIATGKTVVEEPPPSDAVVIPTRGPEAGNVIPINQTAIM